MIDPTRLLIKATSMKATLWYGYDLAMRVRSDTNIDADKKKELIREIATNTESAIKSIEEKYND